MRILFVSDTHITHPNDPCYRALLGILRGPFEKGDVIVLGGDIFDVFWGLKKSFTDKYHQFFEMTESLVNTGVRLYYIEGNHDLHLREVFSRSPSVTVVTDKLELDLEGKRFYFAHGDLINVTDYGYRILRFFFRSSTALALSLFLPAELIDFIGTRSSRYSRQKNDAQGAVPPDQQTSTNSQAKLRRIFRSHAEALAKSGFDFILVGHSHDLDDAIFQINSKNHYYYNCGFPRIHHSYLSFDPQVMAFQRVQLEFSADWNFSERTSY